MKLNPNRREFIGRSGGLALGAAAFTPLTAKTSVSRDYYNLPPGGIENSRLITEPPPAIADNGRLNLGVFNQPVRRMNLDDAALFSEFPKGPWRRARMQEFIGWGVTHPDWHLGVIIIDIQLITVAAFYAMDRHTGESHQYELFGGGKDFRLATSLWDDKSFARARGFDLEFNHRLDDGYQTIEFETRASKDKPAVSLDLTYHLDLDKRRPLVVSLPVEPRHYFYTVKAAAPFEGSMTIGGDEVRFKPERDTGTMDEHRNYYPLPNRWLFACCSGYDDDGRLVGVNMCDNVIKDQARWNENCLWVGDQISLLGHISFDFDPRDPMKTWRMKEANGRLELTTTPDGGNDPFLIPPAGFRYYQKCGPFHGFAIDDDGERHELGGYFGEAEQFELGIY